MPNKEFQEAADAEGYEGDRKKKKPGSGEKGVQSNHQLSENQAG